MRFLSFSARWAHFQAAAKQYAANQNGEDYFSALNRVSRTYRLKALGFRLLKTTCKRNICLRECGDNPNISSHETFVTRGRITAITCEGPESHPVHRSSM